MNLICVPEPHVGWILQNSEVRGMVSKLWNGMREEEPAFPGNTLKSDVTFGRSLNTQLSNTVRPTLRPPLRTPPWPKRALNVASTPL